MRTSLMKSSCGKVTFCLSLAWRGNDWLRSATLGSCSLTPGKRTLNSLDQAGLLIDAAAVGAVWAVCGIRYIQYVALCPGNFPSCSWNKIKLVWALLSHSNDALCFYKSIQCFLWLRLRGSLVFIGMNTKLRRIGWGGEASGWCHHLHLSQSEEVLYS